MILGTHWHREPLANPCDHAAFYAADADPRRPLDTCPTCDVVLRTTPTDGDGWADHWAELRAEDDAYEYGLLLAREMDARW